jgi:hypothetical protein
MNERAGCVRFVVLREFLSTIATGFAAAGTKKSLIFSPAGAISLVVTATADR